MGVRFLSRRPLFMPPFVPPAGSTLTEGFEAAPPFLFTLTQPDAVAWGRGTTRAQAGTYSLKSGTISAGISRSQFSIVVPAGQVGYLDFFYFYSTFSNMISAYFDGVLLVPPIGGGGTVWIAAPTVGPISPGTWVFEARYTFDNAFLQNDNAVYIDQLKLVTSTPAVVAGTTEENFEDSAFNFTTANPAPTFATGWVRGRKFGAPPSGAFWMETLPIGNSTTAAIEFTVSVAAGKTGEITFYTRTDTEGGFDFLRVSLDGVEKFALSGNTGATLRTITAVAAGTHKLLFRYIKDSSAGIGLDAAAIDLLKVVESP